MTPSEAFDVLARSAISSAASGIMYGPEWADVLRRDLDATNRRADVILSELQPTSAEVDEAWRMLEDRAEADSP